MSEIKKDKGWTLNASDGVQLHFTPVFVVNEQDPDKIKLATDKEVECTMVHIEMRQQGKEDISMDVGFQELFMFIYFCCNEELRQALQLRQVKHITEIPYEVTFKLDKGELEAGMAKRLIKVPVDEITMAIVRSEAQLMTGTANLENINDWFRKRSQLRKGRNKLLEKK